MNRIIQAAQFAEEAHRGQFRKYTHRPYIEHPMRVAGMVMTLPHVFDDVVCAAWMHDVLEDCLGVYIPAMFSPMCFNLIQQLTNPSKTHTKLPRAERKAMDREHLRNVSRWAKIIKLVDRIDNIRDVQYAPSNFRELYAQESQLLHNVLFVPGDEVIIGLRDELQRSIDEVLWL